MESVAGGVEEELTDKIVVRPEVIDKLRSGNVDQIILTIAKLCFPTGKAWKLAYDFLSAAKSGLSIHHAYFFTEKHGVSIATFYYIRRRLMNMGLIEKIRGKYYLSEKFSNYMAALAESWDFVRRS